jgi:dihydropyrimidine dehydrogenase (NAD+) subunit PreA
MREKGYRSVADFKGLATPKTVDWNALNMNYDLKARINEDACIECGRCFIACEDTSHQAIRIEPKDAGGRRFVVVDEDCIGCNLCMIACPVKDCITMEPVKVGRPYVTWPELSEKMKREAAE